MKKNLLFFFILFTSFSVFSQDFSNKGRDFWVGYGYHQGMVSGNAQDMVLYIATEQITTVTISIPGTGYTQTIANIPANTVITSNAMPKTGTQDSRLILESTAGENKGIHIQSDKPVVAYAHVYSSSVSGATILFPTSTLGREYYSVNFDNISNSANANCWFYVIAADTGKTVIEITPSAATINHAANVPFVVSLTQGQIYNVMGQLTGSFGTPISYTGVDLTGSKIKSLASGTGVCKRIGVFSGSGRISISCNGLSSSSDNYMVQAFPKSAWGKKYLTVPTAGDQAYNFFRVSVTDPTTIVKLNGAPITSPLINNFYYQIGRTNVPNLIEADKPVLVSQYLTSRGQCGNGSPNGDPEVIYLSPVEQNINKVLWNATPNYKIVLHYFNVVLPNSGTAISSFRLDGAVPTGTFVVHPQNSKFVYLQQSVTQGQHIIESDSGFNAIAYGYGNAESYGYNAGTNIKDLYNFITPISPLSIATNPVACIGMPFNFAVTFPFQPTSLLWDFHGFQTNVNDAAPVSDSTYFIGARQVWRYQLPKSFTYSIANPSPGYPVTITAGTTNPEGCGNSFDRDFSLAIFEPPVLGFKAENNGCISDSLSFTDTTNYLSGTYPYKWWWDFGDGTFSASKNPKHLYLTGGTYQVRYSVISNVGCLSDTATRSYTLAFDPIPKFTITSTICDGKPITFTGSTDQGNNTVAKWFWDFGDGVKDTLLNNSNDIHTYLNAGNKIASLKVQSTTGCISTAFKNPFSINPIPVANFLLPGGVCLPKDSATFIDKSTIADNTMSTFTYAWSFGEPASGKNDTSFFKDPKHNYSSIGPFNVNLKTTSAAGCFHDTTLILKKIYPQALANFSVNPENCLNDTTFFTSKSNGSGSTITNWFWDFGDGSPINVDQNPSHLFTSFGAKAVKHWASTDKGCVSDTMIKIIIVNPLPSANFSSSLLACETKSIRFTDISTLTSDTIITWKWVFNDSSTIVNNTSVLQNPAHIFAVAGNFNVTLIATSNKGCLSNIFSKQITINSLPVANFTLPAGVCLPKDSATFTNLSTIAGNTMSTFTHQWSFGDPASGLNDTSNLKDPTHYYTTVGPFNINLKTTSAAGCFHDTTKIFSNIFPQSIADFSVNPENCLNDSTFFTSKSNGSGRAITNWFWDFGDGSPISVDQNPAHLFTSFGTKTIKHWANTDKGCISDTMVKNIIVNRLPSANFNNSTLACETKSISFTDISTISAGSITAWQWAFNDPSSAANNTSVVQNPTHIFATAGNYNVTLIVSSSKGCFSNIFSKQDIINPLPVANFALPGGVCLPKDSAIFTNLSTISNNTTSTFTYQWSFGDPSSGLKNNSILKDPKHYYNTVGPFNINLKTTSAVGCSHDTTQVLSNIYPQSIADFSVNPENCLNDTTFFISKSNGSGSTITNWFWDFGDGSPTGIDEKPTHIYTTFGTKTIKHWASTDKGCISDTMIKTIIVNRLPVANFNSITLACETKSIGFTDISTISSGSINGWQWVFNDPSSGANNTSVLQNPTHIFATAGNYNVTLIASSNKGCFSNIFNKQVIINPLPKPGFIVPEVCLSDTYALFEDTSSIASGTITKWLWNFGHPASGVLNNSSLKSPTHSYSATGLYTVSLNLTSNKGCINQIDHPFFINGGNPVANFTVNNPSSLCANDSVSITNTSTVIPGTITKIEIYWNSLLDPAIYEKDDIPYVGKLYKHLYPNFQFPLTKRFTVRLRAYSGGVCVNDKVSIITLNAAPKVSFGKIPDICLDANPYTITQAKETGSVPGTYKFTGSGVSPTGVFNPMTAGAGTFQILYTFTSSTGGCIDTASQQITVYAPPQADFIFSLPSCETKNMTFTSKSTTPVGTINTYGWNFGDGSPSVVRNSPDPFTHIFKTYGNYNVTLNVTTSNGCVSTDKIIPVTVYPQPSPNFTFPAIACLPAASITFNNISTINDGSENAFTYLWNLGDPSNSLNNTSVVKSPTHIYTGTGPYNINLQVTSNNGCINDTTIILNTIHPQPKAGFSINKSSICLKDLVTFTDVSNGLDGSVKSWNWNFDDGTTQIINNPPHLYMKDGIFNISLFITNSYGCNSDTTTQSFTVYPNPSINAGPDRVLLEGGSLTLEAVSSGNNLQYLWSPASYLSSPAILTPMVVNPLNDITYHVVVTATGGCTATDDVFIKILKSPKIPNTFTPNGDGINERWTIKYLESYPNCKIQVFTRAGQLVYETNAYSDATAWDGTYKNNLLPLDTYYYILEPGSGRKPITGYVTILK